MMESGAGKIAMGVGVVALLLLVEAIAEGLFHLLVHGVRKAAVKTWRRMRGTR
jgi:hypothetical protein